ncbi:MAG: DUF2778 domain-containing protein [Rhizobiaceae bacterium]|nr:DUF2778 domain-containing protein [Rhizobiaceae bacterium]
MNEPRQIEHAKLLISLDSTPVMAASFVPGDVKLARQFELAGHSETPSSNERFDAIKEGARLTSEKLANLFGKRSGKTARPIQAAEVPSLERFGGSIAMGRQPQGVVLAYATPGENTSAVTAFSALLSEEDGDEDELAVVPDEGSSEEDQGAIYDETPDDGPLPQLRPSRQLPLKPLGSAKQVEQEDDDQDEQDDQPVARPASKPRSLAYARPDQPEQRERSGGLGRSLRDIFGGSTKAGNGVAVYDISAAKVYMPDGTVLEAHSGIGKMADNPRYVNVKMGGATPPHVYNLKLRERLFHGVEAIRMLPVDGKNKYGRDGFLTHSYLLRGGRAESHGCVAFKDYNKFLKAYKQGKVRQIVVVPNGGRSAGIRMASNG